MADYRLISSLDPVSSLDGTEVAHVVDGGVSKKLAMTELKKWVLSTTVNYSAVFADIAATNTLWIKDRTAADFNVDKAYALYGSAKTLKIWDGYRDTATIDSQNGGKWTFYNAPSVTMSGCTATLGNAQVFLENDRPAGQYSLLRHKTAGSLRWDVGMDAGAESGGHVGSNYFIARYSDAGNHMGTPIKIDRSTGMVQMVEGLHSPDILMVSDGSYRLRGTNTGWSAYPNAPGFLSTDAAEFVFGALSGSVNVRVDGELYANEGQQRVMRRADGRASGNVTYSTSAPTGGTWRQPTAVWVNDDGDIWYQR